VRPPGELDELGEAGQAAWSALVDRATQAILDPLKEEGRQPERLVAPGEAGTDVRTIEWSAFPILVAAELGSDAAMELLDLPSGGGAAVGRARQEEYVEWRLIRRRGETRGIEMTTEFREYWRVLAGHEPRRSLDLLAGFGDGEPLEPAALYGTELEKPFEATVEEREEAFAKTMVPTYVKGGLSDFGPHNDGRLALCCMVQRNNSLDALLALALTAARTFLVEDCVTHETRYPSGSEAIAGIPGLSGKAAVDGRNSDPLIVERLVRFVGEGRPVGFVDPIGVYIRQLQLHELAQPDGEDVPAAWLELSRGNLAAHAPDGRSRAQRLKLELPTDADFSLDQLVVRRSGEKLEFGGQLAELVELCAYVSTGPIAAEAG
jgi:hypothetical protein